MGIVSLWPRIRSGASGIARALVLVVFGFASIGGSGLAATAPFLTDDANDEARARAVPLSAAVSQSDRPTHALRNGNPLWGISLDSLHFTRERPLFSPTRRPPPPAVVAATAVPPPPPSPPPPAPPERPQLTLIGTIVGAVQSIGVFVDAATKKVIYLRVGEGHDGWNLRAVRDRKAILEKGLREATLALPARDGKDQAVDALPALTKVAAVSEADGRPITAVSQQANPNDRQVPPGMWLDGDGQLTAAPLRVANDARASTWIDGDGRSIAQPPPSPGRDENGQPLGPAVWLDGYGRPEGPAPKKWEDGDGQTTIPPPYPWLDSDGKAIVPPAMSWIDGDGRFISQPLSRAAR